MKKGAALASLAPACWVLWTITKIGEPHTPWDTPTITGTIVLSCLGVVLPVAVLAYLGGKIDSEK